MTKMDKEKKKEEELSLKNVIINQTSGRSCLSHDVLQNTLWRFDPEIKYDPTEDRFMSHDVTCDKNPKHMYTFNTQLCP